MAVNRMRGAFARTRKHTRKVQIPQGFAPVPEVLHACCPSQLSWQKDLYQAAYEQAVAEVRFRRLALSFRWN